MLRFLPESALHLSPLPVHPLMQPRYTEPAWQHISRHKLSAFLSSLQHDPGTGFLTGYLP